MKFVKIAACLAAAVLLLSACKPASSVVPPATTEDTSGITGFENAAVRGPDNSFSVGEFAYFYFNTIRSVTEQYTDAQLAEMGLDLSKSFKAQMYSDEKNWFEVFRDTTLEYVKRLILLCEAAGDDGVSLDDAEQDYIDEYIEALEEYYKNSNNKSLTEMYGGLLTGSEFFNAVTFESLANKYMSLKMDEFYGAVTEEQIEAYAAENFTERDTSVTRNLMLIYLTDEYNGGQGSAKTKADELLVGFKEGTQSQESFAALAGEFSEYSDYMYENCARGDLSELVDAWLYAEGRTLGDCETLIGDNSCYLLYYISDGRVKYKDDAILALGEAEYEAWMEEIAAKYPITVNEELLNRLES